jgi:2-phospho-L-lactate/phosphoenolpyruvate guanylyltransferase
VWHVIVPLKGWHAAKSRIALSGAVRARLAQAMVADTLAALDSCDAVSLVTVLAADRTLVGSPVLAPADEVVVQPLSAPTLNAGLHWFAHSQNDSRTPLAVVVADLPAARAASLTAVLAAARSHPSAMVADRGGSGTTVLTAIPADALEPHFGTGSALAHQRDGAVALPSGTDLACDVDTLDDLACAETIGLGSHTRAFLTTLAPSGLEG